MNSDSNQNDTADNEEQYRDVKKFHSRRLEGLPRGSFKYRQNVERNRQKIRAYKESLVARNEEGRRSAAEAEKIEKEANLIADIVQFSREEPTYHHGPLPASEQRPMSPPPSRIIKPTNLGHF